MDFINISFIKKTESEFPDMKGHLVVFAGNVGSNVILRETGDGTPVAEFTFAQEVNPDNREDNTVSWYRIECWGPLAQKMAQSVFCRHAEDAPEEDLPDGGTIKGARIMVSGRIDMRSHKDEGSGQTSHQPTIVADEVAFSTHFGPLEIYRHRLETATTKKP